MDVPRLRFCDERGLDGWRDRVPAAVICRFRSDPGIIRVSGRTTLIALLAM